MRCKMNSKVKNFIILIFAIVISTFIGIIIGMKIKSDSFTKHWISSTDRIRGEITDFAPEIVAISGYIPKHVGGAPAVEEDVWKYYLSHKDEYKSYRVYFQINNLSDVSIPLTKVTIQNDFGINLFVANDFAEGVPAVEEQSIGEYSLDLLINTTKCTQEDIDKMKKELKIVIEYDLITRACSH